MEPIAKVWLDVIALRAVPHRANQAEIAACREAVDNADNELTNIYEIAKANNLGDNYNPLIDARLRFKNACRALSHACGLVFGG